ncbi:MAG: hypothetical protein E3K38_13005 [Candidatus Kuenenia stuttgartiensis]|nr:hypothetical protein [Candidatus Kuenenia stuttgartiensis]
MILSAHQPAYLPWLGYFDKIIRCDIFVFLDSVQFEKNSFTNRNKIKTPVGATWLTVPVKIKGHLDNTIMETEIDNQKRWRHDHLKAIFLNYKKVSRFDECYHKLENLYGKEYILLSELCWDHLMFWLKEMGIGRKIFRSSQLPVESRKSDLILDLCRHFGADCYISGALGKNYLNEGDFRGTGIKMEYQDYVYPEYPQLWGDFLPYMSIVDFWMNTDQYGLITGGR